MIYCICDTAGQSVPFGGRLIASVYVCCARARSPRVATVARSDVQRGDVCGNDCQRANLYCEEIELSSRLNSAQQTVKRRHAHATQMRADRRAHTRASGESHWENSRQLACGQRTIEASDDDGGGGDDGRRRHSRHAARTPRATTSHIHIYTLNIWRWEQAKQRETHNKRYDTRDVVRRLSV
jgi:hypothetical protein